MKINWGTGIVIAFAIFITFILYFVLKVQSDSKYDNELVVEEYYKHDALFGDEMVRIQNAQDLAEKPTITSTVKGVSIVFPDVFSPEKIKGRVSFYRSSNKKLDFEVPISSATVLVLSKDLVPGRWEVNMEWQYDGKQYLTKETIYIK
jgi:hypothetical protein